MNIVFTERFYPENGGSIEWLFNLFSVWPAPVIFLTHKYDQNFQNLKNIQIFQDNLLHKDWGLNKSDSIIKYYRAFKILLKLSKGKEHTNIYCAKIIPEAIPAIILKLFRKNVKVYCFVHGEELLVYNTSRQLKLFFKITKNFIEKFVANSNNTKKLLLNYTKDENIIVSYPCISINQDLKIKSKLQLREKYNILPNTKVLLSIARLVERKNHKAVILALKSIIESKPDILYLIVGDGEYREPLELLVKENNLTRNTRFIGKVDNKTKDEIYSLSDIFLLPGKKIETDFEGFGVSFIEAQSYGLPVIAGNTGGEGEAILDNQTGFIVDNDDNLLEKLQILLDNKTLYDEFSKKALEFSKQFSNNTSAEKLYQAITNGIK